MIMAIVGMTGSGKSEVAAILKQHGFSVVRFGDQTDIELQKRGLPRTEQNERAVREELRQKHGMAAYAILSLPRIMDAAAKGDVALDGLYSWEEYQVLKKELPNMKVLAVYSSPAVRYKRLATRKERPLTFLEAQGRDIAEVENLNKGGPIAMADATVLNEFTMAALEKSVDTAVIRMRR
ncbi:AAA family ATPase [Candidatus Woesearchaeota archaeon]|nr:AAA family ATPase [Candidatus Woesearchaeota archaeon]